MSSARTRDEISDVQIIVRSQLELRKRLRRRVAIGPVISHLKADFATFRANYYRHEAATGVDQRDNTKDKAMKVAFLGLGNMAPMGRNLVKARHQVTVWNRTRERAREVSGAVAANTPAEAAKEAVYRYRRGARRSAEMRATIECHRTEDIRDGHRATAGERSEGQR